MIVKFISDGEKVLEFEAAGFEVDPTPSGEVKIIIKRRVMIDG